MGIMSFRERMRSFITYIGTGGEKTLRMNSNQFGGDPRRFTYSICLALRWIYNTFYLEVSGDLMRMWVLHRDLFPGDMGTVEVGCSGDGYWIWRLP